MKEEKSEVRALSRLNMWSELNIRSRLNIQSGLNSLLSLEILMRYEVNVNKKKLFYLREFSTELMGECIKLAYGRGLVDT